VIYPHPLQQKQQKRPAGLAAYSASRSFTKKRGFDSNEVNTALTGNCKEEVHGGLFQMLMHDIPTLASLIYLFIYFSFPLLLRERERERVILDKCFSLGSTALHCRPMI